MSANAITLTTMAAQVPGPVNATQDAETTTNSQPGILAIATTPVRLCESERSRSVRSLRAIWRAKPITVNSASSMIYTHAQ